MQTADWQTAFYFITAGIVLGLGLVWYLAMRQKDRSEDVASDAVGMKDLVARRDVLLEQLREMAEDSNEDDAGKRKLEVECATVLKEIDRRVRSSPQTASAKSATKARSTWIGFAWGVGVTVVAAFLIVTASRSGLRPATMGRADDVESLQRIVQQNPEDLDARLVLAKFYLMRHEMAAVMEQTQFVLARRPDDPRALSYEALVRYARGDPEKARAMLRRALAVDPALLDGWIHLIFVEAREGRVGEAQRLAAEASRLHPEHAVELQELAREFAAVREGARSTQDATPRISESKPDVRGRVEVDPSIRDSAIREGWIFIVARPERVTKGHPLAVQRLSARLLPVDFELDSTSSMMGEELPARFSLEAWLDADGDPATREASEPFARLESVKIGANDLRLVLRRVVHE